MSDAMKRLVKAASDAADIFARVIPFNKFGRCAEVHQELLDALAAVEAQPPAAEGASTIVSDASRPDHGAKVAIYGGHIDATEKERQLLMADCRGYEAKIDAQASRIAALEGALRQAADLIAIPASYHEAELYRDANNITGGTRFSYGAQVHNEACATLLPVIQQALSGAAQ